MLSEDSQDLLFTTIEKNQNLEKKISEFERKLSQMTKENSYVSKEA